jgi:hypothetical protein
MRLRRIFRAWLVLLSGISGSGWAADAEGIWDAPVLAQPFDRAPFRAIRIPAWLRETLGAGYTLSGMNTAQRERAVAAGVTLSEFGFVDPFYAYYDSKLLLKRSPHVPQERLDKDMAEYRRLGVRLLGVYPPCLQGEVYEGHPEWRRIGTNTREIPSIDMKQYPHGGMLCLLGAYGDFFIEVLAEIVTNYPEVSAFSFDGLHYAGVCYCAPCRERFRAETGGEIPNVNMDDPAFRRYQHWADRRMESLIQRMQTRLKGINPNIALVTWTTNAGRFGHFRDIPRNMPARMNLLLDAPDQEFWMDETNRGASIVPAFGNAYAWATTNHRVAFSEPYLMSHGNPYGKDSFPGHEIERRMMLVLTHGALPSLAVAQPEPMQEAAYHALAEVQKRKSWLTDKAPEPWAALVMSDNTRVFYGRSPGSVEERYLGNVFGFFRAGLEEHLPLTLINDWNLTPEELAKYKVLILANTACLDDAQCAAVRGFVERGGGLVASLDTSLCNEFGDARADFALADVLGVNHRGVPAAGATAAELDVNFARNLGPEYWEKRKSVWDFKRVPGSPLDSPKLSELIGKDVVNFKGHAVRVATGAETQTIAMLAPKSDAKGDTIPAIVTHTFGKGRVVYFAAGLDGANYLYSYPYHRVILRNAIDWAAAAPAPISVDAPMCVHAVAMRQTKEGERLVVQLYNDVNTTANHARPEDDIPLREETLPIHDIRVTFRGYKLGRIHLEPDGLDLAAQAAPGGVSVIVPRLDIHAMVVAELVP